MSSDYSIKNIFEKSNKNQVIAFMAGVVIVILLMILVVLLVSGKPSDEEGGVEVVQNEPSVSTEYNEEHEYTLDEYLPWTNYDYLEDESGVEVKYNIEENTAIPKGIVVTVSGCDEETNKANANNYLATLPIELSEYEISYIVEECEK